MAVPKFFEFFEPTLRALRAKSPMKVGELCEVLAAEMRISEEDKQEVLPSGRQQTYKNRINWALQYLKNAGLTKTISRGVYVITDAGKEALAKDAGKINLEYLEQFDSFVEYHHPKVQKAKAGNGSGTSAHITETGREGETPQEAMELADRTMRESLAKSLLSAIMDNSPDFFEHLVVDLLLAMGYGYDANEAGMVVGKTGDGGIDGIINEDKLGFSQVYLQAKRWNVDSTVGRPDVQAFAGAMLGKGATKGLFITTARFSNGAQEYVRDQKAMRIVLVDGGELTRLMIDNGLGVSVQRVYKVMQMDGDYFEE